MPPRAIRVLKKRVSVGPLRKERGVGSLGGDNSVVKAGRCDGIEKEAVGQGEDLVIIMGAGVVVWSAG